MSRARAKSRPKPKKQSSWMLPVLLVLAAILGLGGLALARMDLRAELDARFPMRYVRVEGALANVSATEFREALAPVVGPGFFGVDPGAVERAAVSVSWVGRAKVSRVWPDTLVIEVGEETAVARWGQGGFLSENGEVFKAAGANEGFRTLPVLVGPAGREKQVLDMLFALNGKLAERGLRVSELSLSNRLAWQAVLSNGLEIAYGDEDPLMLTDRAFTLLAKLGEQQLSAVRKLDLRYEKGFVVVWKPATSGVSPEQQPVDSST